MWQFEGEGFQFVDGSFIDTLWGPVDAKNCSYRNTKSQQIFVLSQVEFSSAFCFTRLSHVFSTSRASL